MHHEQWLENSCNTVLSRDMVCLRYVSVNTLHKGDDDDDDDIPWRSVTERAPLLEDFLRGVFTKWD